MSGSRRKIYLDACIFISMLTGEKRSGDESAHVAGLAKMIDAKEIIAVTSSVTRVEVLECTLTEQQRRVMKLLLQPPKVQIKDPTIPVMDLAHEIRSHYQMLKDGLPTVETPDAIHLATAIIYQCDHFYTFDGRDRKGGRPKRGLIPLSMNVAGKYKLPITKPNVEALGLNLGG